MNTHRLRKFGCCAAALVGLLPGLASVAAAAEVPLQPLAQQVRRLEDALNYLGQPLPPETHDALNEAMALPNETAAVAGIQKLLDPFVLAEVEINAESRVKVTQGAAKPDLVEGGTRLFLVKVEQPGRRHRAARGREPQ